eukprot:5016667-Pyramimonas_sp.AAC.1
MPTGRLGWPLVSTKGPPGILRFWRPMVTLAADGSAAVSDPLSLLAKGGDSFHQFWGNGSGPA